MSQIVFSQFRQSRVLFKFRVFAPGLNEGEMQSKWAGVLFKCAKMTSHIVVLKHLGVMWEAKGSWSDWKSHSWAVLNVFTVSVAQGRRVTALWGASLSSCVLPYTIQNIQQGEGDKTQSYVKAAGRHTDISSKLDKNQTASSWVTEQCCLELRRWYFLFFP